MPLVIAGQNAQRNGGVLRARRPPAAETRRAGDRPTAGEETAVSSPDGCGWLPGPAGQAMARRQAVRDFAGSPVPAAQVLAIIAAARGADATLWPPRSHSAGTFEVLVAAFGVGGMPAGLYPAGAGFGTRMAQVEPGWLDSLRDQYADAPVLLLICADLNGACRAAGPAGYPSMLVRAGTLGYAAWLTGIAGGLAGCVYGGTSGQVSEAAHTLNPDLRHVFTVALGVAAGPRQSNGGGS